MKFFEIEKKVRDVLINSFREYKKLSKHSLNYTDGDFLKLVNSAMEIGLASDTEDIEGKECQADVQQTINILMRPKVKKEDAIGAVASIFIAAARNMCELARALGKDELVELFNIVLNKADNLDLAVILQRKNLFNELGATLDAWKEGSQKFNTQVGFVDKPLAPVKLAVGVADCSKMIFAITSNHCLFNTHVKSVVGSLYESLKNGVDYSEGGKETLVNAVMSCARFINSITGQELEKGGHDLRSKVGDGIQNFVQLLSGELTEEDTIACVADILSNGLYLGAGFSSSHDFKLCAHSFSKSVQEIAFLIEINSPIGLDECKHISIAAELTNKLLNSPVCQPLETAERVFNPSLSPRAKEQNPTHSNVVHQIGCFSRALFCWK